MTAERTAATHLIQGCRSLIEDARALAGIAEHLAPKITNEGMRGSLMMRIASAKCHAQTAEYWAKSLDEELAKPEPQRSLFENQEETGP